MHLEDFDELINNYDDKKYPESVYQDIVHDTKREGLSELNLKRAILWKYGKYDQLSQGKKYPSIYDDVISRINEVLPELNKTFFSEIPNGTKIKELKGLLDRKLDRIVTKAWIAHLYFPETCRIIDQHNFRAMHYFLLSKRLTHQQELRLINIIPSTWNDAQKFEQFFRDLKVQNPTVDDRSLDKYLMVYGKRLKKQLKGSIGYSRINTQRVRSFAITPATVPTTLKTWGGRSRFSYIGSVNEGTLILYGAKPFKYLVTANDYEDMLGHFSGRTVSCGTSRTHLPQGSLGEWLQNNVCKTALASYIGSILVKERYAKKKSDLIEFL